jgi:hypothetical protein
LVGWWILRGISIRSLKRMERLAKN